MQSSFNESFQPLLKLKNKNHHQLHLKTIKLDDTTEHAKTLQLSLFCRSFQKENEGVNGAIRAVRFLPSPPPNDSKK